MPALTTAALIALAGVPSYLLWVGLRVGDMNAWFKIQTAGWGTTFDWGSSTWDFLYVAFQSPLAGQPSLPLTANPIVLGEVVRPGVREFLPVIPDRLARC